MATIVFNIIGAHCFRPQIDEQISPYILDTKKSTLYLGTCYETTQSKQSNLSLSFGPLICHTLYIGGQTTANQRQKFCTYTAA